MRYGHAKATIFPPRNRASILFDGRIVSFRDIVPIHEIVDKGLEIIGPAIPVIDVIGVLPDVDRQNRRCPLEQRIFGISSLRDGNLAILDHKPSPAGTELCRAGLDQLLLDLFDRSKGRDERFFESAGNFAAAIRLDRFPIFRMAIMLRCIIEQRHIFAVGFLDDFFQGLAFETAVLQKIIGVRHIASVMLVVTPWKGKAGAPRRGREDQAA